MAKLKPRAQAICNELIDKFIAAGSCDAAQQYTRHIPVRVIAHMLGVPEDDGDLFIRWIHEILELGITDDAMLMKGTSAMSAVLRRADREAQDAADPGPHQHHDAGAPERRAAVGPSTCWARCGCC